MDLLRKVGPLARLLLANFFVLRGHILGRLLGPLGDVRIDAARAPHQGRRDDAVGLPRPQLDSNKRLFLRPGRPGKLVCSSSNWPRLSCVGSSSLLHRPWPVLKPACTWSLLKWTANRQTKPESLGRLPRNGLHTRHPLASLSIY